MKGSALILVTLLLISPLTAIAHGEEVLIPYLIDFVGLIAVGVIIFAVKLRIKGKLILTGTYLVTTIGTFYFLERIEYLTYLHNMALINILIIVIPALVLYGTYLRLRIGFRKQE